VRLYDEAQTAPRLVLRGHNAEVVQVVAAPASNLLASYSWDETTRLWDALTGGELRSIPARVLGFDTSGERLATATTRAVDYWRLQHGAHRSRSRTERH
jgi:WD40 repeat protein